MSGEVTVAIIWLALFVFVLVFLAGAKMLDDTERVNKGDKNV